MRKKTKTMALTLILLLSLISCNNEEVYLELEQEVIEETEPKNEEKEEEEEEETSQEDIEDTAVDPSQPCEFTLNNLEPNTTMVIDCVLDLEGAVVNLPSNTTIVYEEGEIVNGTLNFSEGGVIDGDFLNSTLTIQGSSPQLSDPVFHFDAKRWGIVEGEVTRDVALKNSDIIHELILSIKEIGCNTLFIDNLDAYFYQEKSYEYIYELPSDFHLKMTDNTHLRVFPNGDGYTGNLIQIMNRENVVVSGGHLHGDRDRHDYSSGGTHEQGHLIKIKTGTNIKIENVHMSMAIGDGLTVESYRHHNAPDYVGSNNILITGCTFDANRRNNLSITDGRDIIVEYNTFLNAGIATQNSTGTAPMFAIDVEPEVNHHLQGVDRVTIRNNTESGPHGGLVVASGNDITVEGNDFENGVAIDWAYDVTVSNNKLGAAITAGRLEVSDPRNYVISGNTVNNPNGQGIWAHNPGVEIFDNKLIDCEIGIFLEDLREATIFDNTIENSDGDGINLRGGGNNVIIKGNNVTSSRPFYFLGGENFTIEDNIINSTELGIFQGSKVFNLRENRFSGGIRLENSANGVLNNNDFILNSGIPINIRGNSHDLNISNNYIEIEQRNEGIFGDGDFGNNAYGNMNITVSNNLFNNAKMYILNYDGWTIKDNKSQDGNSFIYYIGNNSLFDKNRGVNGEILSHQIQGSNNTIID